MQLALTELTMCAKLSTDGDTAGELAHREGKNPLIAVAVCSQEVGAYNHYSGPMNHSPKSTSRS